MLLIKNGKVKTMVGEDIENGYVLIGDDGKIVSVGASIEESADMTVIDAEGRLVTPGCVEAHCHTGLRTSSLRWEGSEINESSDPITPHLRGIDAINPFDRSFSDAKKAGVTTILTGPGSANPISGQFAAIKTQGVCVDDMIIKSPAAMKMALGENPKSVYHQKSQAPVTRMGTMAVIRETLYKAKEYLADLEDYQRDPDENEKPEFDIKLEALIPVLKKEIPVLSHILSPCKKLQRC